MDFRQLHYLTVVARCQNVTKAAESLYISQSALSHYIKNAEDELGVRLFDRSTNPISLTAAGRCYMDSAQRILLENARLTKELRDITNHMTGTLSVGTSTDRCSYMIPKLLPRFMEMYPGIRVNVVVSGGKRLTDMLRRGDIDMMLLPALPDDNAQGLESELLYTEELILAARSGVIPREARINGRHILSPKSLGGLSFFLQEQGHKNRDFCDALFRRNRVKPDIRQEFSSNISCYRMAATGAGVTIIPFMTTQLANPGGPVELFSVGDPPALWEVHIFYRKGAYLGLPEKQLIDLAREIFSEELRSPAHRAPSEAARRDAT